MKVKEMEINELKVLFYDQMELLEITKQNLSIIQSEINKRKEIKSVKDKGDTDVDASNP